MPFVKKSDSQGFRLSNDISNIFVGRSNELHFFRQHILKPEVPSHNILSISGQGGVGKSTLLKRLIIEARTADFKSYCLAVLVDERQATPISIMEKLAEQLHLEGEFKKTLNRYKKTIWNQQNLRKTMPEGLLQQATDIAGTAAEVLPIAGPFIREGMKATAGYALNKYHTTRAYQDAELLENLLGTLTKGFVAELNRLAETKVSLNLSTIRSLRLILCFDTFEQLAAEVVPWLLDCFLEFEISNNVVLVVSGRDPLEYATPHDTKRWLSYRDSGIIYSMALKSFTEDETRLYLTERGVTDATSIATLWRLSGGLPLYLGLLTSNSIGDIDPTSDVVDNFLHWIPEQEHIKRRLALNAALFSCPFNLDDFEVFGYLPEPDRPVLFQWLIRQPFVRSQDGRYSYHDVVRALFSRYIYQRSPTQYSVLRRAVAQYYQKQLEQIQAEAGQSMWLPAHWLKLLLAWAYQLLLLPDTASHLRAIEQILYADQYTNVEQTGEIMRMLYELSHEQFVPQVSPRISRILENLPHFIATTVESTSQELAATLHASDNLSSENYV